MMEGVGKFRNTVPAEKSEPVESRREFAFDSLVQSALLESMRSSLEESEFEPEEIEELATALAQLSTEDQKMVLAIPFELRERLFKKYRDAIDAKKTTPKEMVLDILEKNKKYGFTLGYHLSSKQIQKTIAQDGALAWTIKGSEIDDRDNGPDTTNNNVRMAYYSEDYLNRYKKKPGNYLYVVRAEIGESSSHKRDGRNHWGRAPSLSIIAELDMRDIEQQIDAIMKEGAA